MIVYADNAATTRMSETALRIMQPYFRDYYGNPSSSHLVGQKSAEALEYARAQIARCINAEPDEIYFTSGGTESDNWALYVGNYSAIDRCSYRTHGAYSSIEHHAVMRFAEYSTILANENGIIEPREVESVCHENTDIGFVSVMLANNEIGTIQPIKEIAEVLYHKGIFLHTDAVQAVGHIPIDVKDLDVDMLSASAHKFHGPKGVGFLYIKNGLPVPPLIYGGGQERGKRSGTENLPGIAGMAAALEEATQKMSFNIPYVTALREKLIEGLWEIPGATLNGDRLNRLPGIVNFCFDGVDGETLVILLSERGIMASSGSACMTGSREPSHVLMAIGRTEQQAKSALRLSIDENNAEEEIDYILKVVPECVNYLRRVSPNGKVSTV